MGVRSENRTSLYAEVTGRVIAELEQGRLPWVQPWDAAACGCAMPANAVTVRRYSGINVLILWAAVIEENYASQRWLTFRQAQAAGGSVRRGERGTTIDPRLVDAWPRDQRGDRSRFEKLKEAYVKARYSKHYRISAEELAWLGERVEVLGQAVQVICEERIAALERAAAA
jgi:antirestriction protein ArdC